MSAFRRTMAIVAAVAPPVATEIGYRLFGYLGEPMAVHARDRDVHDDAIVGRLEVGGESLVTYTWGSGSSVILLVHGWRGRASQFGAIVRALRSPDRTIVAFDAKGNGDSPGRRTTALDYAEAVTALSERYGGFDAIVGHSLGALASLLAVREGVRAPRIVSIAGMYNADELIASFSRQAGLPRRVHSRLKRRIARGYFPGIADPWRRVVAEVQPTDTHVALLLIHDSDDSQVDPRQLDLIADAHTGAVTTLRTHGLRHSRILGDPQVIAAITTFLGGEEGEPDQQHRDEEPRREVQPEEPLPAAVG